MIEPDSLIQTNSTIEELKPVISSKSHINKRNIVSFVLLLTFVICVAIGGIVIIGNKQLTKKTSSVHKNILLINTLVNNQQLTPEIWEEFIKDGNGKKEDIKHLLYSYDLKTGDKKVVTEIVTTYMGGLVDEAELSPDGTKLYYLGTGDGDQGYAIHIVTNEVDIVAPLINKERLVPSEYVDAGEGKERNCRWSPNNQFLACKLVNRTVDFKTIFKLSVYDTISKSAKDIYTFSLIDPFANRLDFPSFVGWLDNENIMVIQSKNNQFSNKSIFNLSRLTGEMKEIGTYLYSDDHLMCPGSTVGEILNNGSIFLCYSNGAKISTIRGMAEISLSNVSPREFFIFDGVYTPLYPSNNKNYIVWSEISSDQKGTVAHIFNTKTKSNLLISFNKRIEVKGYIEELNSLVTIPSEGWPFSELHHMGLYNIDTRQETEIGGQYIGFGYL